MQLPNIFDICLLLTSWFIVNKAIETPQNTIATMRPAVTNGPSIISMISSSKDVKGEFPEMVSPKARLANISSNMINPMMVITIRFL